MVPRGSSKDPSRPISWDRAGAWTLRQLRESSRSHRTRRAGRPPLLPAARAAAGTEPGAETSARPTTGRRFQRGCETREAAARGRRRRRSRVAGGRPVQSAPGREAAEGGGRQRRLLSREGTGSDSQVSRDNCGGRAGRTGTLGSRSMLEATEEVAEAGGAAPDAPPRGQPLGCAQSRRDWPMREWRREDKGTSPRFPERNSQSPLRFTSSFTYLISLA